MYNHMSNIAVGRFKECDDSFRNGPNQALRAYQDYYTAKVAAIALARNRYSTVEAWYEKLNSMALKLVQLDSALTALNVQKQEGEE